MGPETGHSRKTSELGLLAPTALSLGRGLLATPHRPQTVTTGNLRGTWGFKLWSMLPTCRFHIHGVHIQGFHIHGFNRCEISMHSWLNLRMQKSADPAANCVHRAAPFYVRDLSISGFWCPRGSWNQFPLDAEG